MIGLLNLGSYENSCLLGTGPIVKEALNKHIIKMRVWGSLFSQQVTVRKATGYTGSRLRTDVSKLDLNTTLSRRGS